MVMRELKKTEIRTIVIGSGAAGLNAADRLWQYGEQKLALITERMNAGTSRNTGSDKQTYYKLSLSGGQEDSVYKLAEGLFAGGCVDGEHALCEAALSMQGFYKLTELGVPFPHNRYGEFVGYQTDHDSNGRGTSVGPYTSKYMTEALEREVRRKKITIFENHQVIKILTCRNKVYGVVCLDTETGEYLLVKCQNVVYATGGPAGIYSDSVYPESQLGASGIAFEAGVKGKNLTEWQYGMASLKPRWNVSGSYMQVLPNFISTDRNGEDRQEFLTEYYKMPEQLLDMVFLKGYQWPFDARKAMEGSSIIDLLVYREVCVKKRRVWLDYRENVGGAPIPFDKLSEETRGYLERAGACQETPYERLCHLNMPAVEFYKEHGVDLEKEMLEIAVCAQHNNGGLSVDGWWQTDIEGFFAVGEVAGTHGISRPGGSALNAGQAGSTRAAEYIALHKKDNDGWTEEEEQLMEKKLQEVIVLGERLLQEEKLGSKWDDATRKMSKCAAMLRNGEEIESFLTETRRELEKYKEEASSEKTNAVKETVCSDRIQKLARAYRYYDMRLCQFVYLSAMLDYKKKGFGSRGSALYPTGDGLQSFTLDGEDGKAHGDIVQEVQFLQEDFECDCSWREVRGLMELEKEEAFEVVWKAYREKSYFL